MQQSRHMMRKGEGPWLSIGCGSFGSPHGDAWDFTQLSPDFVLASDRSPVGHGALPRLRSLTL
jgi:hypothetical protein